MYVLSQLNFTLRTIIYLPYLTLLILSYLTHPTLHIYQLLFPSHPFFPLGDPFYSIPLFPFLSSFLSSSLPFPLLPTKPQGIKLQNRKASM